MIVCRSKMKNETSKELRATSLRFENVLQVLQNIARVSSIKKQAFERLVGRDSENLVNPFMRITSEVTWPLATSRQSSVVPPFSSAF